MSHTLIRVIYSGLSRTDASAKIMMLPTSESSQKILKEITMPLRRGVLLGAYVLFAFCCLEISHATTRRQTLHNIGAMPISRAVLRLPAVQANTNIVMATGMAIATRM